MTSFPLRESPKPSYKRFKRTAKQRGEITANVAQEVDERSQERCEWCKWQVGNYDPAGRKWGLQRAHLIRRWSLEETTAQDVAKLCGPSVNSGTCHWKVDYTAEGRKWALSYHMKLLEESK